MRRADRTPRQGLGRWGVLGERDFRLLFLGRTTSFVGGSFAAVALAFAVLDLTGSKADLGYVLAARSVPQLIFLLVGGIWADRLPRQRVMVVSNVVSGASQAAVAVLLLSGHAKIWELMLLAALNGSSSAFFFPASIGIVPETVPANLLQSANALLRLGVNASLIGGAALGGLVIAASSPGIGIACDAGSFFLAALFIRRMHLAAGLRLKGSNFLTELGEGWREFSSRTWLWAIVLQFGFVNAAEQGSMNVLGPAVARDHFGGAAAWGLILTAEGLGLVIGGLLLLRLRPQRLLRAATLAIFITVLFPLALAVPLPLGLVAAVALAAGAGAETFGVLWETTIQQEIPQEKLSRVSSYDALGSFALTPIGLALAGPIAEALGTRITLFGAGLLSFVATLAVFAVPEVRKLQRRSDLDAGVPA